jgi:hypothetical protein
MSTRAVAREFHVHFSTISHLQRCFREFCSTANWPHSRRPCVWRRVGERFADIDVVNRVLHGGGGVMVWADNMMRYWGPLSCHSSAAITSRFSMIMHGPVSQGSVHNSWKLKTSQFFYGLHTHQTPWACLGCSRSMCRTACSSSRQYPETSHSDWRVGQHSPGHNQQPDQLYVKEMCHAAWGKWWSHQILTGFLIYNPTFSLRYLWPTDAFLYSQSCEIHRLGPNEFMEL